MNHEATITHFATNTFLTKEEKDELISSDVVLISPFMRVDQKSTDVFDNCVIGSTKNVHGNLVAVYEFERLVFAHWWDFSEQKNEQYDNSGLHFESDFGRFRNWRDYSDYEIESDDNWYLEAYAFVSEQYVMNMQGHWNSDTDNKLFLVAESNPDLVHEIMEQGRGSELFQIGEDYFILH